MVDYRGGALEDETGAASNDVKGLHERLNRSDCVYLVLDGGYLGRAGAVEHQARHHAEGGLAADDVAAAERDTGSQGRARTPHPSIVILITKADLIPPDRMDPLDPVVEDVQELLSVAFSQDLCTLICPVTLGHFGLNPPAKVKTSDIDPQDLHLPIIFSLAEYMYQLSAVASGAAAATAEQARALDTQLTGLRAGAGGWLRHSEIGKVDRQRNKAIEEQANLQTVQRLAADRATALFDELGTLPTFRSGIEVNR